MKTSKKWEQESTQLYQGMDVGHYNYIQRNAGSNVARVKLKAPVSETKNTVEAAQKEAKTAPHTNMVKGEKGILNKLPDTNKRKYRDIVESQTGEKVSSAGKIRAGSLVSENIGSRKVLRGEKNNLGKDKKDEIKIFVAQVRPKIQKGKEVNSVLGDADRKKDLSNVGTVGKTGPYIGGATVIARQEEVTRRQCGDQQKLEAKEGVNVRLTHRITISANSQTMAYAWPDREIPQGSLVAVPFKSVGVGVSVKMPATAVSNSNYISCLLGNKTEKAVSLAVNTVIGVLGVTKIRRANDQVGIDQVNRHICATTTKCENDTKIVHRKEKLNEIKIYFEEVRSKKGLNILAKSFEKTNKIQHEVKRSDDFMRRYEYAINAGKLRALNKELSEKSREINSLKLVKNELSRQVQDLGTENQALGLRIKQFIYRNKIYQ